MDLTAPFKDEVLRPITTWVIPGSIAIAPYILILGSYVPRVMHFWDAHEAAGTAVITICVLTAGLILDNVGASIESNWWDRLLVTKYSNHLNDWDRYLKLRIKDEIVAQRYLKDFVMRMKFELSMAPALLLFWGGLMWLNALYAIWEPRGVLFMSGLLVGGALYFLRASYVSARVLSRVRTSILEAIAEEKDARAAEPSTTPA